MLYLNVPKDNRFQIYLNVVLSTSPLFYSYMNSLSTVATSNNDLLTKLSSFLFADINECSPNSHRCNINAICKNTQGSYACTCKAGYTGNGRNCIGKMFIILFTKWKGPLLYKRTNNKKLVYEELKIPNLGLMLVFLQGLSMTAFSGDCRWKKL